jgi:hypothetical protein
MKGSSTAAPLTSSRPSRTSTVSPATATAAAPAVTGAVSMHGQSNFTTKWNVTHVQHRNTALVTATPKNRSTYSLDQIFVCLAGINIISKRFWCTKYHHILSLIRPGKNTTSVRILVGLSQVSWTNRQSLEILSTASWSPMSNVGYMEREGM